jgi:hypothetical protein
VELADEGMVISLKDVEKKSRSWTPSHYLCYSDIF